LGGGATASSVSWPLAAIGQPRAMPVIGVLNLASLEGSADLMRAFRQGLKETGHAEGENVAIEYRWAENQADRLPALAAELVRRQVAVLVANGGFPASFAARAATTTIPIVFIAAEDPVRRGLVTSLARPGGNLTGVNFLSAELVSKRLELLRELVPAAAKVAVLVNPNGSTPEVTVRDAEVAARAIGLKIQVLEASSSREIDVAFATLVRERLDALFVGTDAYFSVRRVHLTHLSSRHAIPATYGGRQYAEAGGLMSYGSDLADATRQMGIYAGRILKGAKPADLPVMQSTNAITDFTDISVV
jgi:ABC-type uncharacterized transport system substrate-binding protein